MSDYGEQEVETEDQPIDRLVPPSKEKLQPQDPHALPVYENRVPWIRPPPVERSFEITNTRRLVHFVPRRLSNGLMAMFEHSRSAGFNNGPSSEHSNLFVDRYNGRILDVGEYAFPLGVVDPATYGVPGPRTYFFEWHGLHGWRSTVPTTWMYQSNQLREGQWVGRVPSQPSPGQLPLSSPAMTEDQSRSYNLQLRRKPVTKKGKEKLFQRRTPSQAPVARTSQIDAPVGVGPPELISLENAFVGMSARDVWNSAEVTEMRRRQHGPRSITRLQSRLIFQFRSQEEERQSWLYFGRLRQLNDSRMDSMTPSDFAEVSMLAYDVWDYDREDAVMDYSEEIPLVGTSSQAIKSSSSSRRTAVPAVQPAGQIPPPQPVSNTSAVPQARQRMRSPPPTRPRPSKVVNPDTVASTTAVQPDSSTSNVPQVTTSAGRPIVQSSDRTEPWHHPDFASFLEKERAKVRRKRERKYKEAGLDPRPLPEPPLSPVIRNAQRPRPLLLTRMDVPPTSVQFEEPDPQWSSAECSLLERLKSPPGANDSSEPVLLRRMRPVQERFAVTLNERMYTQERLRDPTPEPEPTEARIRNAKNARQEARDYARAVAISEVEDVMPATQPPQMSLATDQVPGGSNAGAPTDLLPPSAQTGSEQSQQIKGKQWMWMWTTQTWIWTTSGEKLGAKGRNGREMMTGSR
ncbi:hypothetical protein C8F01DRAFT_1077654 [Mycena amicta]|nr:hypothetical protein C8F01DRAFT_1077654 [Mycena amicta]